MCFSQASAEILLPPVPMTKANSAAIQYADKTRRSNAESLTGLAARPLFPVDPAQCEFVGRQTSAYRRDWSHLGRSEELTEASSSKQIALHQALTNWRHSVNSQTMLVEECEPRPFLEGPSIKLTGTTTERIVHHLNWNAVFSCRITNRRIS